MEQKLILTAPKLSMKNKTLITSKAGCYQCLAIVPIEEITKWTDNNQTAVCPKCDCDCLIPEGQGIEINVEALTQIHDHWLGKSSQ